VAPLTTADAFPRSGRRVGGLRVTAMSFALESVPVLLFPYRENARSTRSIRGSAVVRKPEDGEVDIGEADAQTRH